MSVGLSKKNVSKRIVDDKVVLKQKISKASVVSFDIFDTLVFRNVSSPRRIFDIVEFIYNSKHNQEISFKNIRINSEIEAVKKGGREISYDDIYIELEKKLGEKCADELKHLEIEIELAFVTVNTEMFEIYRYCLSKNKTIVIVSDMYLPQETIENILRKNGYTKYYRAYVSNECGCSKRNGKLYEAVCKDLKIVPSHLLHIGDSMIGDVAMGLKYGIHVYHYKPNLRKNTQLSITGDVLSCFIRNQVVHSPNFYQIGYSVFGPFLYGFISWLVKKVESNKYDKVLFFSRDGFLMKKVFDLIFQGNTETLYVYASRRVLLVSTLWMDADYDHLISSMYIPAKMSVRWFISSIGLNPMEFHEIVEKFELDLETVFLRDGLHREDKLRRFFEAIKQRVIDNSKKEYEALVLYLKGIGITGRIAIVDIGWTGSMQVALEKIIENEELNCKVDGLYLGVDSYSKNQDFVQMSGYLFQKGKNLHLYKAVYFLCDILELFFLAPHGSANYYYIENGESKIKLDKFEYEDTNTFRIFSIIQRGAKKFVLDFHQIGGLIPNDEIEYSKYVIDFFGNPSLKTAELFGNIKFYEKKWYYLAKPKRLIKYIIRPGELKKDIFDSQWKVGFMKRMFKMSLPYSKILHLVMFLKNVG